MNINILYEDEEVIVCEKTTDAQECTQVLVG